LIKNRFISPNSHFYQEKTRMEDFDYRVLLPYKVDFSTSSVGKYIKQSKKKCSWRWGFAHIPSIESGKTDVECRGKEMELTLIWSVTSGRHEMYLNNKLIHVDPSHGHLIVEKQFEHTFYVSEAVLKGNHIIKVAAYALGIGSHSGRNQFSMSFDGQEYNNFWPMYDLGSESMKAQYRYSLEPTYSDIPRAIGDIVPSGHSGNPSESLAVPMAFAYPVSSDLPHSVSNDQDELRLIEEAKLKSIQDHELHQQRSVLYPKNPIQEQEFIAQAKIQSFRGMHQTTSAPTTPTTPFSRQLPVNDQNGLLHFEGSEVPNILYSPNSSGNSKGSHELNFPYSSIDSVPFSPHRDANNSNALVASASVQYTRYEIPPDEPDNLSRRLMSEHNKFLNRW